jgi:hypothetical protein
LKKQGIASIQSLSRTRGGRCAHVGFLVDLWCVGLKDAFGRSEVANADLSDFGIDGGLRYVGPLDFLQQRLTGCTPDQFLDRQDVQLVTETSSAEQFMLTDEVDEDDQDDELLAEEQQAAFDGMQSILDNSSDRLADQTRRWCAEKGPTPHAQLDEGARMMLAALIPLAASTEDPAIGPIDIKKEAVENLGALLSGVPADQRDSTFEAITQVHNYMTETGRGSVAGLFPVSPDASETTSSDQIAP